jgi:selenocysteine-specific elongation factor
MPRDDLRIPLTRAAAYRDFNAVIHWLAGRGVLVLEGGGVRLPEHAVEMPPGWRKASDEIVAVYRSAKFQPPAPGNFQANYPRDVSVPAILTILEESGELVHIADDLYLHRGALAEVKDIVSRLASTPEGITVASVRDATGSSRKVILPLLEYLDAQRFTRRQGDARVLV